VKEGLALGLGKEIKLLGETAEDGQRAAIAFLERQMSGAPKRGPSSVGRSKRRAIRRESIFAGSGRGGGGQQRALAAAMPKSKAKARKSKSQMAAKLSKLSHARSPLLSSSSRRSSNPRR